MITILNKKSDELGMLSSALCMLHCFATPFLFVALPSSSVIHPESQQLWGWLDVIFLGISFIAIFRSVQQSNVRWLRVGLIFSWLLLAFLIFNERFAVLEVPFYMVYFPAFALIVLHLINRKNCRCQAGCCDNVTGHHRG